MAKDKQVIAIKKMPIKEAKGYGIFIKWVWKQD